MEPVSPKKDLHAAELEVYASFSGEWRAVFGEICSIPLK